MAKNEKFTPKASIGPSTNNSVQMDRKNFIQWLSIGWLAFAASIIPILGFVLKYGPLYAR